MKVSKVICLTENRFLGMQVLRAIRLNTAGVQIYSDWDHVTNEQLAEVDFLFLDGTLAIQATKKSIPDRVEVILSGDTTPSCELIELMKRPNVNYLLNTSQSLSSQELLAIIYKMSSGHLFGLQKYLSSMNGCFSLAIESGDDKANAIECVVSTAKRIGCRQRITTHIASLVEELLLNAVYPTKNDESIKANPEKRFSKEMFRRAEFQWAYADNLMYLSVTDSKGSFEKNCLVNALINSLKKEKSPATGIGIQIILNLIHSIQINIDPQQRCEVILTYDLDENQRTKRLFPTVNYFSTAKALSPAKSCLERRLHDRVNPGLDGILRLAPSEVQYNIQILDLSPGGARVLFKEKPKEEMQLAQDVTLFLSLSDQKSVSFNGSIAHMDTSDQLVEVGISFEHLSRQDYFIISQLTSAKMP